MARIILGSYFVRYPLGGMMSWVLQYLIGFHRLGHEVYFVEKAGCPGACYDPYRNVMSDDCALGTKTLDAVSARFGMRGRWCFVDAAGCYYGLGQNEIEEAFCTADLFVDMGTHGAWGEEAAAARLRVLIDGEPGFTQIKMAKRMAAGETLPVYDRYYTNGRNVGTPHCFAPTAGKEWGHLFHPVVPELFKPEPAPDAAPFTTVMNWQSHAPIEFDGVVYGQKDLEFRKFTGLPKLASAPMEIAVSGKGVPRGGLRDAGWRIRNGHDATITLDAFEDYIRGSRGEFTVCKNVFVAMRTGWFSDRSAAYLAAGRPVVMQETGFSRHLPCGDGLFAVGSVEEAAAAIDAIQSDWSRHSIAARRIAEEYLDAEKVLGRFLDEIGI